MVPLNLPASTQNKLYDLVCWGVHLRYAIPKTKHCGFYMFFFISSILAIVCDTARVDNIDIVHILPPTFKSIHDCVTNWIHIIFEWTGECNASEVSDVCLRACAQPLRIVVRCASSYEQLGSCWRANERKNDWVNVSPRRQGCHCAIQMCSPRLSVIVWVGTASILSAFPSVAFSLSGLRIKNLSYPKILSGWISSVKV